MKKKAIFIILIFFITLPYLNANEINIRILLFSGNGPVDISSTGHFTVINLNNGEKVLSASETEILKIENNYAGIKINGIGVFSGPLIIESDSFIIFNNKKYRGTIKISTKSEKIYIVNKLNIEEYLYGVLPSEIPPSWHDEIVKAQAVVARTFAIRNRYYSKSELYDMDCTVLNQVYKGYDIENTRMNKLIDSTRGQVIIYKNKLIEAYYHSCCGGHTESSEYVWSKKVTYLKGTRERFCIKSPNYHWNFEINSKDMVSRLSSKGYKISDIRYIKPKKISPSGRIISLYISDGRSKIDISSYKLRFILGLESLKSTYFNVRKHGRNIIFKGKGFGHGVGLCQWGAKKMAESRWKYTNILKYYYRGTKIVYFNRMFL